MAAANMGAAPALMVPVDPQGIYQTAPTTNADGTRSNRSLGSPSIATGQIAVGTSSTLVVPARTGRLAVTITATSAVVFYVGVNGVTVANGAYAGGAAGASITIPTQAAVYAIGASALTVSYLETF